MGQPSPLVGPVFKPPLTLKHQAGAIRHAGFEHFQALPQLFQFPQFHPRFWDQSRVRLSFSEMQDNGELAEIGQLPPRPGPLLKPAPSSIGGTGHTEMRLALIGAQYDEGLPRTGPLPSPMRAASLSASLKEMARSLIAPRSNLSTSGSRVTVVLILLS